MFKYFQTNYVWNLSVDLAIEMGAKIGEIEEMCAPLQEAARQPDAAGTRAFRDVGAHGGSPVRARGRRRSARPAHLRRRQVHPRRRLPADRRALASAWGTRP